MEELNGLSIDAMASVTDGIEALMHTSHILVKHLFGINLQSLLFASTGFSKCKVVEYLKMIK